jgi:hypothetical protein
MYIFISTGIRPPYFNWNVYKPLRPHGFNWSAKKDVKQLFKKFEKKKVLYV